MSRCLTCITYFALKHSSANIVLWCLPYINFHLWYSLSCLSQSTHHWMCCLCYHHLSLNMPFMAPDTSMLHWICLSWCLIPAPFTEYALYSAWSAVPFIEYALYGAWSLAPFIQCTLYGAWSTAAPLIEYAIYCLLAASWKHTKWKVYVI